MEEFERESAAIREELIVKDALALDDLTRQLARDRRCGRLANYCNLLLTNLSCCS